MDIQFTARKTPDGTTLFITKDGIEKILGEIVGDTLRISKSPRDIFRKKPSIAIAHTVLSSPKLVYSNIEFYIGEKVYKITRQKFWQNAFYLQFKFYEKQAFCPLEHFYITDWQMVKL
ncbi:MAG: hypothetical protein GXX85_17740 [Ignavibacteria bacterium]|nr:hypothetical protein [Ignavibacteria bacterium]